MFSFRRVLAVVAIVAVLGGGSLGLGISLGFVVGRQYTATLPYQPRAMEESVGFAFDREYTEVIPVEVRVSDISGVVQAISGSVVSINILVPSHRFIPVYSPGSGSGIIFAESEDFIYIATNNHVVDSVAGITISLDDEYEVEATLIGGDWDADLAVLSVPRESLADKEYHIAVFGDSDHMLVGDEVIAIGNPMGQGQTATRGIISATNREITVDGRTLQVLQTDAAINPGNSGGALANIHGEVIGINTAKAIHFQIEGMGYAIPSNEARIILDRLLHEGTRPRPFLGIEYRPISERDRRLYALPSIGVMVFSVIPYSSAYDAGLQELDLIVGFDGAPITNTQDFITAITATEVGQTIHLQLYRLNDYGFEPMTISATLGDMNAR